MASAANAYSEQENREPDRPRITRRTRGNYARTAPLDLEYLQRPSYCDAGFALEQIAERQNGREWEQEKLTHSHLINPHLPTQYITFSQNRPLLGDGENAEGREKPEKREGMRATSYT
ncbi:unnamed protein product [Boreogadus saida]